MKTLLTQAIVNGQPQNLLIDKDIIAYVGNDFPSADKTINLTGKHLIPSMIDPHTHIRDLGQTDKEDWVSASKSALKGGVTMVFDMPNNKPPTINLHNLNLKRTVAKKSLVRYRFNIAATSYNLAEVEEMLETNEGDIASIKVFLAGSNASEYVDSLDIIEQIFSLSLKYDLPVMVHSEWQSCVEKYTNKIKNPTVLDHNYVRNRVCAEMGTEIILKMAEQVGNQLYIVHTSIAEEIDLIRQYKDRARVYCEVTPHHLLLAESILEKVGNYGKVNPPIRTLRDNEAIWGGIQDGTVDTIGSDHAPHLLSEKNLAYQEAPSGFPGLETSLPLLLQEVKKGRLSMDRLVALTSTNSANLFGLNMGVLAEGYLADLVVIDLDQSTKVTAQNFSTKAKYSPFEGMDIVPIEQTFVKGILTHDNSITTT